MIGPSDQLLPQKLVTLYFSFFKFYVDKNDFDAKILSALLTGVNRALPFLRSMARRRGRERGREGGRDGGREGGRERERERAGASSIMGVCVIFSFSFL